MKTIWKFPVKIDDEQTILMPAQAKILSIQVQNGGPCMWALCDSEKGTERRKIYMRGTGHDCDEPAVYPFIGTFQMDGGALIFHAFDGGIAR